MGYDAFLQNPYIARIAKYPCWTISDKEKRPVDIVQLRANIDPNQPGRVNLSYIPLAKYFDKRCLVTLDILLETFPKAANLAYYVQDAVTDGYVILDVEPSCPQDLKDWFLKTNYIYGEYSLSGKGLHLVYPVPACFSKYPNAQKKNKMQTKDRSYEFMVGGHFLTFTGRMLPPATGTETIDQIFEDLCKEQVYVEARELDISAEKPEIPNEEKLLNGLKYVQLKKTPADFNDDASRYEFSACSVHFNQLRRMLASETYNPEGLEYTDNQKAWLIYLSVKRAIRFRKKHEEFRQYDNQQVPWLLYEACTVIAKESAKTPSK